MRSRSILVSLLAAIFMLSGVGTASAADYVRGSVLLSPSDFEYTTVLLKDTRSDGFIRYVTGIVPGERKQVLFDPYNEIWFTGPIVYKPTNIYFAGRNISGFKRVFGDGTVDNRFFFANDGNVYQRVDVYDTVETRRGGGELSLSYSLRVGPPHR